MPESQPLDVQLHNATSTPNPDSASDSDEFPYPRNWKCCLCKFIIPRSIGNAGPPPGFAASDAKTDNSNSKTKNTCPKCRNLVCPLCGGTCLDGKETGTQNGRREKGSA